MRYIIFFLSSMFFIACSSDTKTFSDQTEKNKPVEAYFFTGGFHLNSYKVEIKNSTLTYVSTKHLKQDQNLSYKLTQHDIKQLESIFKTFKAHQWQKNYMIPDIMDGSNWEFRYHSSNFNINSRGNIKYPPDFHKMLSHISRTLLDGKRLY